VLLYPKKIIISFRHSLESGCIFKNLIYDAFQMQTVKLVLELFFVKCSKY
jgi:hypothetical protein